MLRTPVSHFNLGACAPWLWTHDAQKHVCSLSFLICNLYMFIKMSILGSLLTSKCFPLWKYINLLRENFMLPLFMAATALERKTVLTLSHIGMNLFCTDLSFVCAVWLFTCPDVSLLNCSHDHFSVIYCSGLHSVPLTGIGLEHSAKY